MSLFSWLPFGVLFCADGSGYFFRRRLRRSGLGERKEERCSLADLGFEPDFSAIKLYYFLNDRQPDTGAFKLIPRGKGLEYLEDAFPVFLFYAGAVVGDAEFPEFAFFGAERLLSARPVCPYI